MVNFQRKKSQEPFKQQCTYYKIIMVLFKIQLVIINSFLFPMGRCLWSSDQGCQAYRSGHSSVFLRWSLHWEGAGDARVSSGNGNMFLSQLPVKGIPFLRSASVHMLIKGKRPWLRQTESAEPMVSPFGNFLYSKTDNSLIRMRQSISKQSSGDHLRVHRFYNTMQLFWCCNF